MSRRRNRLFRATAGQSAGSSGTRTRSRRRLDILDLDDSDDEDVSIASDSISRVVTAKKSASVFSRLIHGATAHTQLVTDVSDVASDADAALNSDIGALGDVESGEVASSLPPRGARPSFVDFLAPIEDDSSKADDLRDWNAASTRHTLRQRRRQPDSPVTEVSDSDTSSSTSPSPTPSTTKSMPPLPSPPLAPSDDSPSSKKTHTQRPKRTRTRTRTRPRPSQPLPSPPQHETEEPVPSIEPSLHVQIEPPSASLSPSTTSSTVTSGTELRKIREELASLKELLASAAGEGAVKVEEAPVVVIPKELLEMDSDDDVDDSELFDD